jgi:hypothetical protein
MPAMFLELTLWVLAPRLRSMTWQNATARFIGSPSPTSSSCEALLGQRLPAADDLGRIVDAQLVVLVLEQLWMRRLTWLSSIESTMTL